MYSPCHVSSPPTPHLKCFKIAKFSSWEALQVAEDLSLEQRAPRLERSAGVWWEVGGVQGSVAVSGFCCQESKSPVPHPLNLYPASFYQRVEVVRGQRETR